MPTVLRENGFEVRIYPNDHEPAHVHVFKAGGEAKIQIKGEVDLLELCGMKNREVLKALDLIEKHHAGLLEEWYKYHGKTNSYQSKKSRGKDRQG